MLFAESTKLASAEADAVSRAPSAAASFASRLRLAASMLASSEALTEVIEPS